MVENAETEWLLSRRRREWISEGGSAIPLIELLLEIGRREEAAAMGRLALKMDPGEERPRIEELLATVESTPEGWSDALHAFSANPSREAWDAIIRFAPSERIYDWIERAIRDLVAIGCEGDAIIRYASQTGITPEMIALVEDGRVTVETLLERGELTEAARAVWLGLAAQAAYLEGDRFRAISLLRESRANDNEWVTSAFSIFWIREQADEEMAEMMRKAGVWEIE